jgi:hypothetical protein
MYCSGHLATIFVLLSHSTWPLSKRVQILIVLCEVKFHFNALNGITLVSLNSTHFHPKYQETGSHPTLKIIMKINYIYVVKIHNQVSFDVQGTRSI